MWLGKDRKCSAAVVGLDLVSGLSMVQRCSLSQSFKHRYASPMYCKLLQRATGYQNLSAMTTLQQATGYQKQQGTKTKTTLQQATGFYVALKLGK